MAKNTLTLVATLDNTYTSNSFRYSAIYGYKNKRFQILFDNSNGQPCGFDNKHCLSVFDYGSNKWNYLADIMDIRGLVADKNITTNYFAKEKEQREGLSNFIEGCAKYIKALYD